MSYTIIATFTLIYCSTLTLVAPQAYNENSNWLNSLQNPLTAAKNSQQQSTDQGSKFLFLKYLPNIKPVKGDSNGWLYETNGPILFGKRESGSRLTGDLPPPPPGFVGSRGRRGELVASDNEIRSTLINKMAKSMGISPLLLLDRLRQNESKKKDLILPYKDAFMGSRG